MTLASELFEDIWPTPAPILEPIFPDEGTYPSASYPLVGLAPTGRSDRRELRTLILENPFLRITVCPDLGGRIVGLFDRRTQTEFSSGDLTATTGGKRGAHVPFGVTFGATPELGLDLGPVQVLSHFAASDEMPAGVTLGGLWPGTDVRFWCRIELPADSASFTIQICTYASSAGNRVFPGLRWYGADRADLYSVARGQNRLVFQHPSIPVSVGADGWISAVDEFDLPRRTLETWEATVTPTTVVPGRMGYGDAGVISLSEEKIQIQVVRPFENVKVVLFTRSGQSLDSRMNLHPESIWEIPLADLPEAIVEVALLDESGDVLARTDANLAGKVKWTRTPSPTVALSESDTRDPAWRHLAFADLAEAALIRGDFLTAAGQFERSLRFNAEDPLAWWGQAFAERLANETDNDAPLPNAHYLNPVEPLLRAEAFLRSDQGQAAEKNPLLAPLAETPESLIEVAATLLTLRRLDQLARFADEGLRHLNLPMLRYLLAYALLEDSRMGAEAAQHVQLAAKAGFAPPFPHREIEFIALRRLADRFPEDTLLAKYAKLGA